MGEEPCYQIPIHTTPTASLHVFEGRGEKLGRILINYLGLGRIVRRDFHLLSSVRAVNYG